MNPFIAVYNDPVFVLGSLAYALLLLGVSIQLAARGWNTFIWLWNAWDFRNVDAKYGDQWTWYLPPPAVYNRVCAVILLAALEAFLLGAFVYVIGNIS